MKDLNLALSKTTRPPFGEIKSLPEMRIGMMEVLLLSSEVDASQDGTDLRERLATIARLQRDMVRLVWSDPQALTEVTTQAATA